MAETNTDFRERLQKIVFKALKATLKSLLFYGIYLVLWSFFAPVSKVLPGLQQMVETFVMVYLFLMFVGDLTSGTIFQYFFSAAKALFVICYLILSLKGGIYGLTYENVSLSIDLHLFLMIATLLSLLGFAKSVLQAINYMSEKEECTRV